MTRKMLWDLFMHTGKIEYYMKYKSWGDLNGQKRGKV